MNNNDKIDDNSKWINRWAGSYTFISCHFWARQYKHSLDKILGMGFDTALFVHKKGTASFYVKKSEFERLGNFLANQAVIEGRTHGLLTKLRLNTDRILALMDKLDHKIPYMNGFNEFREVFENHLALHVFMKKTVDFLDQKSLVIMLPEFKAARLYSESVYSRTESFFRSLARAIGQKENIPENLLTCLTEAEFNDYLSSGYLPSKRELSDRFDHSVILFKDGKVLVFTGKDASKIEEKELAFNSKSRNIIGISASSGKVTGIARVVMDPFSSQEFNEGDILVTGMTRPEFSRFIGKAAAIVTDAGGRLCHAAIIAREQNIPCIVGTENATRIIKELDKLEVDADNGKINIIDQ